MQKLKNIYPNLLIMIGFIIPGVVIGILFGYGFIVLDEAGAFGGGSWNLLKSPLQFEHISDATTRTIWAKTRENKLYKQTYCLGDSDCNQWAEAKEIIIEPLEEDDTVIINELTCTPSGLKYPLDPHGKVIECALAAKYWSSETKDIIYYALLSDGAIWVWRSSGPWYVGLGTFILLVSPVFGLILGIFMYGSFQKNQKNKIRGNV